MDATVSQPMPAAPASAVSYPVRIEFEAPNEVARWRPFVHFIMAIPHFFVLLFLFLGAFFVWFLSFWAILFTGKYPEGMRNYMVGVMRWFNRVNAYVNLMTDQYPPFSLQ